MDFFTEIFQYSFLANAVIASLLAAFACGIVGTYIVVRRLVFLSGGITHSSFGGIGIAYYLGLDPILGAAVFAVLSAFGIEMLSGKGSIREDSAIGILWSVGMAVGVIFVFLTPGYAPNLMSFLFGNILLVTTDNIVILAAFDVVLLAAMVIFYRAIIYTALDGEYAASRGVRVRLVNLAMLTMIALAIVLNIKVVGIVLLVSLLTLPAVTASQFCRSYKSIMVWSVVIAVFSILAALAVSNSIDVPAGALAVIVLANLFFVTKCVKKIATFAKKQIGR
ncbi:Zinc ABC transporter/inner membrane permease protein ZnuB [Mucinivorans hirudinis]|uniref:Zinc ABC transporter/inner membrane permease protein ZnuB n=1 Tax=Mucinivorans hirudinis TaxID=1433126 RepID=A0A060R7T1_9BACT|nr:Zinc ABC transporter/inner membrane permease protein ZnuB [Mucinivorans hirudinis]